MAENKIRKRRFASKLRSGCKTCKRRHVKCSEERPRCSRCISSGRRCEGYDAIRIATADIKANGDFSLVWSFELSSQPDATLNETLAFKYFQYSCGSIVHHGSLKYRPLFQYILQIARHEPSIWHATVALGSLQKPNNAPLVGNRSIFGYGHYGKAVKILNESLASQNGMNAGLLLAGSLLFATFEVLLKEFSNGYSHINGSLNYLCDLISRSSGEQGPIFSSFVDVFARLAISASIFGDEPASLSLDPFAWLASNIHKPCESSLESAGHFVLFSLAAMRFLQHSSQSTILAKTTSVLGGHTILDLQEQLLNAIRTWQISMQQAKSRSQNMLSYDRVTLLKIYMKYCEIVVSAFTLNGSHSSEVRYDKYISEFSELLHLCKGFIKHNDPESIEQDGMRYPSFTIHIGIIHILWYICIKCRDPSLRREALCMLASCHHAEGDTFDGIMIAGYAEMVIRLEEGPEGVECAEDLPYERRIRKPHFNIVHDDHILHCEKGDFKLGPEWTTWQPVCAFSV